MLSSYYPSRMPCIQWQAWLRGGMAAVEGRRALRLSSRSKKAPLVGAKMVSPSEGLGSLLAKPLSCSALDRKNSSGSLPSTSANVAVHAGAAAVALVAANVAGAAAAVAPALCREVVDCCAGGAPMSMPRLLSRLVTATGRPMAGMGGISGTTCCSWRPARAPCQAGGARSDAR